MFFQNKILKMSFWKFQIGNIKIVIYINSILQGGKK